MGEEAATEESGGEELLNELPEGDDGWEYIEEDATEEEELPEENLSEEVPEKDSSGKEDEEEDEEKHRSTLQELERAVEESSVREIERIVTSADLELGKGDVTGFVRRAEVDITRTSFVSGKDWEGTHDGFSEIGWLEDGELTAVGASVLAYAGDVIDEAGDEAALVGYLNSVGVDVFLKEALRRGPDEEDEGGDGGFIGGLLG